MIALWFLAGGAIEVLNTLMRCWSIEQVRHPARAFALMAGGLLFRLVATALVLMLAFRHSPISGLMALVGYWICRWIMIGWVKRRYPST